MNDILVVVPGSNATIWGNQPWGGPTEAYHAYRGTPFMLKRAYAERFADRWIILSDKYGFIRPNFVIPEPYQESFRRKSTNPVGLDTLRQQIQELKLDQFWVAVGLGAKEYQLAVKAAFAETGVITVFPFAGLPAGQSMHALKYAIQVGDSGIPRRPQPTRPLIG